MQNKKDFDEKIKIQGVSNIEQIKRIIDNIFARNTFSARRAYSKHYA